MSLCCKAWFIVEKEFEVGKNWLRKKLGWSTYAFKVVIATILLLLYNTVRIYRPPHHDHHDHRPSTPVHSLVEAPAFPIGHLIEQALTLIDLWIVGGIATVVCGAARAG